MSYNTVTISRLNPLSYTSRPALSLTVYSGEVVTLNALFDNGTEVKVYIDLTDVLAWDSQGFPPLEFIACLHRVSLYWIDVCSLFKDIAPRLAIRHNTLAGV